MRANQRPGLSSSRVTRRRQDACKYSCARSAATKSADCRAVVRAPDAASSANAKPAIASSRSSGSMKPCLCCKAAFAAANRRGSVVTPPSMNGNGFPPRTAWISAGCCANYAGSGSTERPRGSSRWRRCRAGASSRRCRGTRPRCVRRLNLRQANGNGDPDDWIYNRCWGNLHPANGIEYSILDHMSPNGILNVVAGRTYSAICATSSPASPSRIPAS